MGLQDRNRPAWGGDGAWGGLGLEPVHIPALTLVDAFETFEPRQGRISPYPWASLQRPEPAIGGSPEPVLPDDPEGLNALAGRAQRLVGDLSGEPAKLLDLLDASLVTRDASGDIYLPAVGDGGLTRTLLERADLLDGVGEMAPTVDQWLAVLALALLGKAEQLIREIDRDAAQIYAADPTESEFFENEFNRDRLNWFRRLAAECAQAVAVAETLSRVRSQQIEQQKARSRKANEIRHAPGREFWTRVERVYLEKYRGSGQYNKELGYLIYNELEPYDRKPDGTRIITAEDPATAVERKVGILKKRYGDT